MAPSLAPFPFHRALRDHFKQRTRTWEWFSGQKAKDEQIQSQRTALLKNTYRLDPATFARPYELAAAAVKALNVDAQVTLYQEQNTTELNAGIFILDKEAHIVLSGRLMELLTEREMLAVLGHELAHYLFYQLDSTEHEITTRIAYAIANDERTENVHVETARLYRLYLELFCDRGALQATGELEPVLSSLIKLHTGLAQVNTESFIQQAKEAVHAENEGSDNSSHPENYIRCLALHAWSTEGEKAQENIERMVRGPLDINNLDLFRQRDLQKLTHDLLQVAMKPQWIYSTAMAALVGEYMPELKRSSTVFIDESMREAVTNASEGTCNYLCYVLLDIALADNEQEEVPMGHVLEITELLGMQKEFDAILRRELKLGVRELKLLKERSIDELSKMKDVGEESLQAE